MDHRDGAHVVLLQKREPAAALADFAFMEGVTRTWLINNPASKSNDDSVLAGLQQSCADCGFEQVGQTVFPDDAIPAPADLDAAGVNLVVVFAGDGTIATALDALAGWGGRVLVLPGGTKNLLYHRLFGDMEMEDVLQAVCSAEAQPCRPGIIRSPAGNTYAGALAGPGTTWGEVREAMRDYRLVEMAADARDAMLETLEGDPVICAKPALGRPEGYPLIVLTPHDDYFEITAYHAENTVEFVEQMIATMRRQFRDGPHEVLGREKRATLTSSSGTELGLLLDGEQRECGAQVQFELARCEVDLLATRNNGR